MEKESKSVQTEHKIPKRSNPGILNVEKKCLEGYEPVGKDNKGNIICKPVVNDV